VTRAEEMHQSAKLAAVERLGPDADDAAIANCACELLAAYASQLENEPGVLVGAAWEMDFPQPLDPDPLDVMERREEQYEAECRRNGEEV